MKPGLRLALLAGCVFVAALVSPQAARVAAEDCLGPYALTGFEGLETRVATALPSARTVRFEEGHGDSDGDVDPEAHHDAP